MKNETDEVLLEKDRDGRLLAVQGVQDGNRVLLPINKANLDTLASYDRMTGQADEKLREYLKQTPVNRSTIILKASIGEIASSMKENDLSIGDFSPAWLSEHVLDLHRYMSVPKTEVQQKEEVFHALKEEKINKDQLLQEMGINIDSLRESGDLDKMLNFGRSRLITSYPVLAGVCFPMQVKLSLRERNDGTLAVIPHPIKLEPNLNEYRGYRFTDEDRKNLLTTGNLGHTVTIDSRLLGTKSEVYLSLDRETNELVALSKKSMHIPQSIKGVELTEQQKRTLEDGGAIHLTGMKSSNGQPFEATIQVNAERRSLVFKKPAGQEEHTLRITDRLLGKEVTEEIKQQWKEGKWVYMENMMSRDGRLFSAYVRPNFEKNKFDFVKTLPEEALENRTKHAIDFLDGLRKERDEIKRNGGPDGPLTAAADAKTKEFDRQRGMKL